MTYKNASTRSLLQSHAEIISELKQRKIVRTGNNPLGDLAEHLFCKTFGWRQEGNSKSGYDAVDDGNCRYQIKSRRIHPANKSRQLSALRNLDKQPFDMLAVIIFEEDYTIRHAALIPHALVLEGASYRKHVNGWLFHARDTVFLRGEVVSVKPQIETTFAAI